MGRSEVIELSLKPCALMLKDELHEAFEVSQELGLAFGRVPEAGGNEHEDTCNTLNLTSTHVPPTAPEDAPLPNQYGNGVILQVVQLARTTNLAEQMMREFWWQEAAETYQIRFQEEILPRNTQVHVCGFIQKHSRVMRVLFQYSSRQCFEFHVAPL